VVVSLNTISLSPVVRPFVEISAFSDRLVEVKLLVSNPLKGTARIEKPAGTAFVVYPAYRIPSSSKGAAFKLKQAKAIKPKIAYFFIVNLLN
jgi:hypothetical protein